MNKRARHGRQTEIANIREQIQSQILEKYTNEDHLSYITQGELKNILKQYAENSDINITITNGIAIVQIITKDEKYPIEINDIRILVDVEPPTLAEVSQPTTEISTQFIRTYGVVEIAWLDLENNIIANPLPIGEKELGGMTPITYTESNGSYNMVETTITDKLWYNYTKQNATSIEYTSRWANAMAQNETSTTYFVWIPRYAYKIIYFDTATHMEDYKQDSTNTAGIVGYSVKYGMVDKNNKIVTGTERNITNGIDTSGYSDYIPHPAFKFGDDDLKGIWVGKFVTKSSGAVPPSTSAVPINGITYVDAPSGRKLRAYQEISMALGGLYGVELDTHVSLNTEHAALAYLMVSGFGVHTGVTPAFPTSTGNPWGVCDLNTTCIVSVQVLSSAGLPRVYDSSDRIGYEGVGSDGALRNVGAAWPDPKYYNISSPDGIQRFGDAMYEIGGTITGGAWYRSRC